jgi:hypothetical protein
MLYWLNDGACPRKLRRFALACCRRIWDQLDEVARALLILAERYCEGEGVSKSRLKAARHRLRTLDWPCYSAGWSAVSAVRAAAWLRSDKAHGSYSWVKAAEAADRVAHARLPEEAWGKDWVVFAVTPEWREERAAQAQLLRDIYGNPFASQRQAEPAAAPDPAT